MAVAVLLDCNCGGLAAFSDAFLGATWSSWTPLGLNLEALVRFLGPTWSVLGASWAQLGASWSPLGHLLGSTWSSWTHFGSNLALLNVSWVQLGASWAHLGGILGSKWSSWTRLNVLSNTFKAQRRTWTEHFRFLL